MSLAHSLPVGICLSLALGGCASLAPYGAMMTQPASPAAGAPATQGPTSATSTPTTSAPTTSAAGEKASGPSTVSVTIRNTCSKTVKVFFGDKPKFGSGTYSTASSNSSMSHTFQTGDSFWIVDDHENGIANVSVEETTHQIEIGADCAKLAAR